MLTDDGRTDAGVTGILLAHQWALGSGELKSWFEKNHLTTKKHAKLPIYGKLQFVVNVSPLDKAGYHI